MYLLILLIIRELPFIIAAVFVIISMVHIFKDFLQTEHVVKLIDKNLETLE